MIRSRIIDSLPPSLFYELPDDMSKKIFLKLGIRELGLMARVCHKFDIIQNISEIWKIHAEKVAKNEMFSLLGNFNSGLSFKEQVRCSPETYNSLVRVKDRVPDLAIAFKMLKDFNRNKPNSAPYHSMIDLFAK